MSSLPLHLFNFKGRLGRLSFLGYTAVALAIALAGVWAPYLLLSGSSDHAFVVPAFVLMVVSFIGLFWVTTCLAVKRLHDLGKPGTMLIAYVVTGAICQAIGAEALGNVLTIAFNAWLFLAPGQSETNQWGPPQGDAGPMAAAI